jgi:hypothetical protein
MGVGGEFLIFDLRFLIGEEIEIVLATDETQMGFAYNCLKNTVAAPSPHPSPPRGARVPDWHTSDVVGSKSYGFG